MVKYVFEDLFDRFPREFIMEQKNCFGIHGGLSYIMAKRFPSAAKADLATEKGDISKLGTYQIIEDCRVINAYGQFDIGGEATNYDAWERILESLVPELEERVPLGTVRIPFMMGCGLGGGNWEIMENLLDKYFSESTVTLLICIRDLDYVAGKTYKDRYESQGN
jgi:hypothetical protein